MPIEISKAKWQATRPERDCKDTGIGKVADAWKTGCTEVGKLATPEAILQASARNQALKESIATTIPVVKKSTSPKKQATLDLLDDWSEQVEAYAKSIAAETKKRQEAEKNTMLARRAKAYKVADDAIELTQECQATVKELKDDIKNKIAALEMLVKKARLKGDPDGSVRRSLRILVSDAERITEEVEEAITNLRKDVSTGGKAPLRQGGKAIAEENELDAAGTKQMIDKYNEHKGLMDKLELDAKTVKLLFRQVQVDAAAVEQALDQGSALKAGYAKILKQVLTQMEAAQKDLGARKSPTTLKWTIDKAPGNDLNNVEQQLVVQEVVLEKWRKAKKRLDELVSKGLGYVPKEVHGDPELAPLVSEIDSLYEGFSKEKIGIDLDYTKANEHLKKLAEQLG